MSTTFAISSMGHLDKIEEVNSSLLRITFIWISLLSITKIWEWLENGGVQLLPCEHFICLFYFICFFSDSSWLIVLGPVDYPARVHSTAVSALRNGKFQGLWGGREGGLSKYSP